MEEEFGQYNFNFLRYVIKNVRVTDDKLIIEGINDFTVGRIIFEELEEGFESDDRMIGGKVFGICIWRLQTAAFAEQNGRNAELIGRRPLLL